MRFWCVYIYVCGIQQMMIYFCLVIAMSCMHYMLLISVCMRVTVLVCVTDTLIAYHGVQSHVVIFESLPDLGNI